MDDVSAFFNFSKDFERKPAMLGAISGSSSTLVTASLDSKPQKREKIGTCYAREEMKNMQHRMDSMDDSAMNKPTDFCGMETLEDLSDAEMEDFDHRRHLNAEIYKNYKFDLNRDTELPIHDTRTEILDAIRKNYVTILEGDTGCGKTTQVPQYLLDDAFKRNEYCNIICTQPRRIAAISIARRVCNERSWELGSLVGYQVGLHANQSDDTRLLYCTTGVLLQKLITEKTMERYTHVILDEVHERDQDMDFLLLVVRNLLTTVSKRTKIILMSATISTSEFAQYFNIRSNPAPVMRVDKRRQYQVREFYLDDLERINKQEMTFDEPGISDAMYHLAVKLIVVIENIETQESVRGTSLATNMIASILVFLPGIQEIDELASRLADLNSFERSHLKAYCIRLHSLISPDEQCKVFNRAPAGFRKVILATNIAESSITVPDVKYVIDFCLTKNLYTDTATNFSQLQLQWASKANCRQRSGRAGRVMNGRVYRLIPKNFYEHYLDKFTTPEMLRAPLENVVLKAKLLDLGPPSTILGLAMSPPNLTDIRNTIMMLKEIGALHTSVNGIFSLHDGDLSFSGRVMAHMPLDCRLTRLILLGYIFSCLDEAIIIAAGLSVRSICRNTTEKGHINAFVQKMIWADGSGSDLFAILKVYRLWSSMREQHNMNEEEGESTWAKRYFINLRSLKEMNLTVLELKSRLASFGIKEQNYNRVNWSGREKVIILKVIISGAFYPNYFVRGGLNEVERERIIYHTLCGNDPTNTVYLTNFDTRHIGQVYIPAIKQLFRNAGINSKNIEIRFQPGSERVFVTFKPEQDEEIAQRNNRFIVPGNVRPEIYKSVRMRHVRTPMSIRMMDLREELRFAEHHRLGVMQEGVWIPHKNVEYDRDLQVLPNVFQNVIRGRITHIEHCSKFYFQPLLEMERLLELKSVLRTVGANEKFKFGNPSAVGIGMTLAAPLGDKYQRAKVLKAVTSSNRREVQFKVFFIDFGSTAIVDFDKLRCLNEHTDFMFHLPPRVFECRLANVQPSSVKSPHGKWHEEANELLRQLALAGMLDLEIYSVVRNVANVTVMETEHLKLNETLIFKGYASKSEESYMSKSDHDLRWRKQSVSIRSNDSEKIRQIEEYFRSISIELDVEGPFPPSQKLIKHREFRGPFSPLEVPMYSAIRSGQWKAVKIEPDSVNFVLIDSDPQNTHERLIVAASVSESKNQDNITARATTLMPNIHGFPALMTMLFSPRMQLKTDANKTKYVSLLAGLGCHPNTGAPMFEEHDIVLNLDVELSNDDVQLVNQLRYCMDTMVYCDPGHEQHLGVAANVSDDLAVRVKGLIIRLLNKNRKYIETHASAADYEWDFDPEYQGACVESHRIFPDHTAHTLYDEKYDHKHALGVHCLELHRLRQFDGNLDGIKCQLCNQFLENIGQLRIHLLSQLHCDRESQIGFKMPSKF